jgi:hypothetical protein
MISIVLYGRNDNYGYNLHKRAALSLNCMAEILSDRNDEILFVDYNTPDDYPTFPEAIQDTLTERAKACVRVLRVRSHLHRRFEDRTHLLALEPIARNVAVRRSNPANRWILSTNTDMIFVPRSKRSLTELVRRLDEGFYHLPRFEIPESLWETLDRADPVRVIEQIRAWGYDFHLNEVVLGQEAILYDGPGDFQLMLRSDLFDMCGFDERMLVGWHVDSNIAKRMFLRYGRVGDMLPSLLGYHCDHTRQVTPAHRPDKIENDSQTFVTAVETARLSEQAATWGMPDESIEEIDLRRTGAQYVSALRTAIGPAMQDLVRVGYKSETYDTIDYDPRHVVPFLADVLVNYPSDVQLGWFGCRRDLLDRFCMFWRALGDRKPILVSQTCTILGPDLPAQACWTPWDDVARNANAIVFDFGLPASGPQGDPAPPESIQALEAVAAGLRQTARVERQRSSAAPRRLIAVNAIHNRFESMVREYIAAPLAPLSTRMRQGFLVRRPPGPRRLLAMMPLGKAGLRDGALVHAAQGVEGHIVYGPYLDLEQGSYRLRAEFVPAASPLDWGVVRIEVMDGPYLVAYHVLTALEAQAGAAELVFSVPASEASNIEGSRWEFRIWTDGRQDIALCDIAIEHLSDVATQSDAIDWLPSMQIGAVGQRLFVADTGSITIGAKQGVPGHVAFGPYCHLRPGPYVLHLGVDTAAASLRWMSSVGHVAVVAGGTTLRRLIFRAGQLGSGHVSVPFDVPSPTTDRALLAGLEFQIWTDGRIEFELTEAVVTERSSADDEQLRAEAHQHELSFAELEPEALLAMMPVGQAGRPDGDLVRSIKGTSGHVVYGPYLELVEGCYRLQVDFSASTPAAEVGCVRIEVMEGRYLVAYCLVTQADVERGIVELLFQVGAPQGPDIADSLCEFRVWTDGEQELTLREVSIERRPADSRPESQAQDWLPFMRIGDAGTARFMPATGRMAINARRGARGHFAYGPYEPLRPDAYILRSRLSASGDVPRWLLPFGTISVVRGRSELVRVPFGAPDLRAGSLLVPFDVSEHGSSEAGEDLLEFQFWTDGRVEFELESIEVGPRTPHDDAQVRAQALQRRQTPGAPEPLLRSMLVGDAGQQDGGQISSKPDVPGCVAYGPYVKLDAGRFRVSFDFAAQSSRHGLGAIRIEVAGGELLAENHVVTGREARAGTVSLVFEVPGSKDTADWEFRITTDGTGGVVLREVWLEMLATR